MKNFIMFLEIMLAILLGLAIGLVTGLAPGIHPNTVFAILLSAPLAFAWLPAQALLAFIVSLAISNTFFDFIPSIIFGAPEEESVLSVLPGHRLLLEGNGYEAVFLTVMGGLGVILLATISLPLLFFMMPLIQIALRPLIHIILILAVSWMVYTEKNRLTAALIFLASGIFGFISLSSLLSDTALFPALTGLFGISTILTSLMSKTNIPEQQISNEIHGGWLKGSVVGLLAGLMAGFLPGLGSSQTGIIASQALKAKVKEFLIALGGISTSNVFFTFIVFYTIGKTRSGAVWAVSQVTEKLTLTDICLIITVGVMVSLVSAVFTLKLAKFMLLRLRHVNYMKVNMGILLTLAALVVLLSDPTGVIISITGVFMGLLAISTGVKRTHLMGFLVLPTILYFSGLNPAFTCLLWC